MIHGISIQGIPYLTMTACSQRVNERFTSRDITAAPVRFIPLQACTIYLFRHRSAGGRSLSFDPPAIFGKFRMTGSAVCH